MNGQPTQNNMNTVAYTAAEEDSKIATREIAALVLGILSLYFAITGSVPVFGYIISLVLGIVGVVMARKARMDNDIMDARGIMCCAGYVCSIVGIVLSAMMLLAVLIIGITAGIAFNEVAANLPQILSGMDITLLPIG